MKKYLMRHSRWLRTSPLSRLMAAMVLFCLWPVLARGQIQVADGVLRVGTIDHIGLTESSGLAASRRYPGVVWSHNDGGFQFLFAMNTNGQTIGAFQVVGANLIDWEAMATDTRGNLYLADIGGDGMARSHVAVHRLKEPKPSRRYGNARVNRTWLLKFPGVKEDCESFFVLDGYGYLIARPRTNDQVTMYRFPLSSRRRSVLLEEVTKIDVTAEVTDATVSQDNQRLGMVTEEGVYLIFINGNPATANTAPRRFTAFQNAFMEGGTFSTGGFLVSAETRELWLFNDPNFQCLSAPSFPTPLADKSVLLGGTIQLDGTADGCPLPTYQWRFNGTLIPGQTNGTLPLAGVTEANVGTYEVTASNRFGVVSGTITLSVRTKQDLRITEVMPSPAFGPTVLTADWWELTSFESTPVDLTGWRVNDSTGGLTDPYVLPAGLTIAPGESIVFVEGLTPADFRGWWGDSNLPSGLQIFSYSGSGLSFRIIGDTVSLWDNISTDPDDTVARAVFGAATPGVSFTYNPVTEVFGGLSQLGVNGAVRAVGSTDIGSPGRITAPAPGLAMHLASSPAGLLMRPSVANTRIRIEFAAVQGRHYTLEVCDDLGSPVWEPTGDSLEATRSEPRFFEVAPATSARFFRIRVD